MIREPYNVSPYNEAKDLSQNPQFSFTFGGDALVGYDYKILDNSNKNNILKDWSSVASTVTGENIKYLPTIDSGAVATPTTQLGQTVTIYNDEDYYFDCANILNSDLYTNKGLVWKLRLFEDNITPSNIIQIPQGAAHQLDMVFVIQNASSSKKKAQSGRHEADRRRHTPLPLPQSPCRSPVS